MMYILNIYEQQTFYILYHRLHVLCILSVSSLYPLCIGEGGNMEET